MNFKCSKSECDGTKLEEVMAGVTLRSEVVDVEEEEVHYGGSMSWEDGKVIHYQCGNCGKVLMEMREDNTGKGLHEFIPQSQEELYEFLKERNMV